MSTGIRGGTPIENEEACEEARMLADLAEVNQHFRTKRAQYLKEAREQALATYQPPPSSPTPERGRSSPEGDLLTPPTTPSPLHPRPPRSQSQLPLQDNPKPATSFADLYTRKVPRSVHFWALAEKVNTESGGHPFLRSNSHGRPPNETPLGAISDLPPTQPVSPLQHTSTYLEPPHQKPKALGPNQRRTSQRSTITTRSKASPHPIFMELEHSARRSQKRTFIARESSVSAQVASPSLNPPTPSTKISSSSGVNKRRAKRRGRGRKG
ncbi:MAG: hypothetical protein Q9177_000203 [Variospora cf. flavescens]